MEEERIRPEDYAHSPAHYLVALGDAAKLARLLATLPRLPDPSSHNHLLTVSESARQDRIATAVSSVLDRRDVPCNDTALHLAVRLDLYYIASALLAAGADPSLQNSAGWTPLQEALSLRRKRIAVLLVHHHRLSALRKLHLRLPPLLAALRRLPDLQLHLSLRLVSPLLPKPLSPSHSLLLHKHSTNLRADTSLLNPLHGLRSRRGEPHSFLFLSSASPASIAGSGSPPLPPGSLLILNHSRKEVRDAFEEPMDDNGLADDEDGHAYRPGLDITAAKLVPQTSWRGREKTEMVGEWKAKVYDIHNVVFSFKTMKAVVENVEPEVLRELNLDEDEEGFLVAEMPVAPRHSCYERGSSTKRDEVEVGRRRSLDLAVPAREDGRRAVKGGGGGGGGVVVVGKRKEKEMLKSLRPTVWLAEDFPLKTEELLPMMDVLANKVKAVRRIRELLTAKFPPGTFPVKLSIPIVPTVRLVVTFTKFVNLQMVEEFFTPLSSPRLLSAPEEEEEQGKAESVSYKSSWLKWSNNSAMKASFPRSKAISPSEIVDHIDPFSIPSDYKWVSINSKSQNLKKSKSRRTKE